MATVPVKEERATSFELANDVHDKIPRLDLSATSRNESIREDHDRDELIRLGKKPVLKRNFGFMSILGFSCTILITWEGSLVVFNTALTNGGPVGLIYGFIFVWIGAAAIYTSLSELCSMAPTAGGQYHWVSLLAPASSRKFLSWLTGVFTVIGWQASLASAVYVSATLIQGVVTLTHPAYTPQLWQAVLLFWATMLWVVIINTLKSSLLPKFEGLILILHIFGYFAILVALVFLASHHSASYVFTTFNNGGNWPTNGLSFMVGLAGASWCFIGADGAVHMSEEIKGASNVVPRSILTSILINGSLGLSMIIAMLFCLGDMEKAQDSPTDYPFMEVFAAATGSTSGAAVMISIIIIMQLCADVGLLAAASRMLWSFARDRGLPGGVYIARVNSRTSIPTTSILVTTIINILLSLIIFGSTTAFNNLVSIGVVGLFSSYLCAAGLLLYRRCTGGIKNFKEYPDTDNGIANRPGAQMIWGPWRLPSTLGIIVNAYACIYMTIIVFFVLWPPERPVTAENMNYSVVIVGGLVSFGVVWYLAWAKGKYNGPVVEVTSPEMG